MLNHKIQCNNVKRRLIQRFCKNSDIVVDLCCGRGGDILKWDKSNIKRVIGIDKHPESISEAIRRYKKLRTNTKISFYVGDVEIYSIPNNVDSILCQFALHYISDMKKFLSRVHDSLKVGGYFIGICTDGDTVRERLQTKEGVVVEGPLVINHRGERKYSFKFNTDLPNNYFNKVVTESEEFYVYKLNLIKIAEDCGLHMVEIGNLKSYWGLEEPTTEFYFSFVFQKLCV